ncbi:MAG: glycosyltransferase [Sphingomonas sp.]|nr:glycosyltransferase [Sphingomonas sp.]
MTIIVEWENAIDVPDQWTRMAMDGLARELAEVGPRLPRRPRVMYLYDRHSVSPKAIEVTIEEAAPRLPELADLILTATDGLTYYQLKNYGVARAGTELSVMIDSDAVPQPGWLEAIIAPFDDPEVMAVGGFTMLGHDDFLSRAMALSWIFDLVGEGEATERRKAIHVNNFAVRTEFFRAHPFPDLQAYKKQCVIWLRAIRSEGHRFVRTSKAMAIHAPHPGVKFLVWRAWTAGLDADFLAFHTRTSHSLGRFAYAFVDLAKSLTRAWYRILFRAEAVEMPVWERPFALLVALTYYLLRLVAQLGSSLTRHFDPLPTFQPMAKV